MTATTSVKLTHHGMTRRLAFPDEHPPWVDITQRAEALFKIPAADVGLSYVDPDGDTMYLTSNDELFDMYHTEPSQPQTGARNYRFTVHDMRHVPGKSVKSEAGDGHDSDSDSSSSSSVSGKESSAAPNITARSTPRAMGSGLGGMGFGFAPFEMMFGPAATAASVKSPSQGHLSPVPTGSELGAAAIEAGQTRSQFGRSVVSSVASSVYDGHAPEIHIQQPSTDAGSVTTEHPEPLHTTHPTPALYHDVAHFVHALAGAVGTHPEVSTSFSHLIANAHSGIYWDETLPPMEAQQASTHNLLSAINSFLHVLLPPPPPRTPTQAAATPAYTAAGFELPPSVIADETPIPSRLNTPSVASVHMPEVVASPAMTATSIPSTVGPAIRPVLDMARADRESVRSYTDAGSIVGGSVMGSPIYTTGPAWRFAGRTGGATPPGGGPWRPTVNTNIGAVVPVGPGHNDHDAAKYVESRVKLEHMKEMYKQTKEEYRREREERKKEKEMRKQGRLLVGPPEPPIPPPMHGDMFDKLNEALAQVPGRVGGLDQSRKGVVPPPAASVAGSAVTHDTAVRTRQQLNNWLIEQLGDMGFSAATHPQVNRMVRDATRPYASNAENANENALLEDLLAQLVPTGSGSKP